MRIARISALLAGVALLLLAAGFIAYHAPGSVAAVTPSFSASDAQYIERLLWRERWKRIVGSLAELKLGEAGSVLRQAALGRVVSIGPVPQSEGHTALAFVSERSKGGRSWGYLVGRGTNGWSLIGIQYNFIVKSPNQAGAGNRSQPVGPATNRAASAAGSGR
jgi:hypothetical protein